MKRLSLVLLLSLAALLPAAAQDIRLTHVSFDISREVVKALGDGFYAADWAAQHPGSTVGRKPATPAAPKQAQSVVGVGFPADVVTMNQYIDVDFYIAGQSKGALVPANWQTLLPHNASPFSSTMVLVVRAGNPERRLKDWEGRPGPARSEHRRSQPQNHGQRPLLLADGSGVGPQPVGRHRRQSERLSQGVPGQCAGPGQWRPRRHQPVRPAPASDVLITFEAEGSAAPRRTTPAST